MTLTKQDLQDWNSNPVTQAIFKEVKAEIQKINAESVLSETCDQTAMKAAYNDGMVTGAESFIEVYEDLLAGSE